MFRFQSEKYNFLRRAFIQTAGLNWLQILGSNMVASCDCDVAYISGDVAERLSSVLGCPHGERPQVKHGYSVCVHAHQ